MQQKIIFFSQLPERQKETFYNVFIRKNYSFTYDDTTGLYYAYITVNDQKSQTNQQQYEHRRSVSQSQQQLSKNNNQQISLSQTFNTKQIKNNNLYHSEILFKRKDMEQSNQIDQNLLFRNTIHNINNSKYQSQASEINSYSDESEHELSENNQFHNKSSSYVLINNSDMIHQKSQEQLHRPVKNHQYVDHANSIASDEDPPNSQVEERQSIDQLPKLITLDNNDILDPSEDIINKQQRSFINDRHENKLYSINNIKYQSKSMQIASESYLVDLVDQPDIVTNPYSRERSLLSLTGASMSESNEDIVQKKSKTLFPELKKTFSNFKKIAPTASNYSATLVDLMEQQNYNDHLQQNISPIQQNDIEIASKPKQEIEIDDFYIKYKNIIDNNCIQWKNRQISQLKSQTLTKLEHNFHCFFSQMYKYRYNANFQFAKGYPQHQQATIQQLQKDFQQLISFYLDECKSQLLSIFKSESVSIIQEIYFIIIKLIYVGKLKYIQYFYDLPGSLTQFSYMYYQILTYGHKLMTYEDVIKVINNTYIEVKQRRQAITFLLKHIRNLKCSAEVTKISDQLCSYITGKSLEKYTVEERARSSSIKQQLTNSVVKMEKPVINTEIHALQGFNQHLMLDKSIDCDFSEHFPSILTAVVGCLDKSGQLVVCSQLEREKSHYCQQIVTKIQGKMQFSAEFLYNLALNVVTQACQKIIQ